jgi:hypothetical protein
MEPVTITGTRDVPTAQDNVTVTDTRPIPTDEGTVTVTDTKPTDTVTSASPTQEGDISNIPLAIVGSGGKKSALSQALGITPQMTSGTTEGLTGGDEGSEIQSQETGGKRQNVWNESSLRLRDALGLG